MNKHALGQALCAIGLGIGASLGHAAGSLYDQDSFRSLTADRHAVRAGDVLTIQVFESSSASTSAGSTTNRASALNLGFSADSHQHKGQVSIGDDFSGKGTIQRSGKLVAQITATVQSVMPNGDLAVAGRQSILVNNDRQDILLTGRVRQRDIAEDNTVPSTRLADAQISYLGDGAIADKQKPGVISRIMTWLGL